MNNNVAPSTKNPIDKGSDIIEILKDAGYKYNKEDGTWEKGLKTALYEAHYGTVDTFYAGNHTGTKKGIEQIKAAFPVDPDRLQTKPFKLAEATAGAKMDYVNSKPPEPHLLIKINNQSVLSTGNIATLIGKAKSGKTSALTLLISQVVSNLPPGNKIHWFDSEQSAFHVYKIVERLEALTGLNKTVLSTFFDLYSLRQHSTSEREQILKKAAENFNENDLVIFDGARDLINNINDPSESNQALLVLMNLTDTKKVGLLTILHTNKGDANARGHIGTELVNKSETVMEVIKSAQNDEITLIECRESRNAPFKKLAFRWDASGVPVFVDPPLVGKNGRVTPSAISTDIHTGIVERIFSTEPEMMKTELAHNIQSQLKGMGTEIGTNRISDFIQYYQENNLVIYRMEGKRKIYSKNFK